MFSVHGSSGSNFVVLRMLALEHPDALVLVARNIHHSVVNALKAFGLDFRFLPAPYDARFEAVLPPSVEQIMSGFQRHPEALAVIYTSPTYEGLAANTSDIVAAVHDSSPTALVIVDEAWGGHLHFHPELPPSAMASGADLCVQSTHKLAGGLQQTGLIHWHDRARRLRADGGGLPRVRHDLAELPPAGVRDAAVRALAADGEAALGACIDRTRELKDALRARMQRARPPRRRALDAGRAGQRRRLRPDQDDDRALALRRLGLRRRRGARRARDRGREGGRADADVHHDLPDRRRRDRR